MNDQDARRIIENWIAIQRYSLTVGNLIGGMIDDMLRELRGLIGAENATQQIADVVRRYFFLIRSTMTQEQIAAAERLVIVEAAALGAGSATPRITKALVDRALSRVMPAQQASVMDLYRSTFGTVETRAKAIFKRATDEGLTLPQVRQEIATLGDYTKRAMDGFARTSINAVSNQAKAELYEANADITDRYLYLAHYDSRVSAVCAALDGKIFKQGEGPIPPMHPNCRSHTAAILIDETNEQARRRLSPRPSVVPTEKYERGDHKTRTGRPRKARRGSQLEGAPSTARNYETWLRQQPAAYARDILGDKGYEALKSGKSLESILRERTSALDRIGLEKALN